VGGVNDGDQTPSGIAASVDAAGPSAPSPPARETVIELRDAISLIERFPALAGVDLAVTEGEIVLLRGPNGAGKSTLLRLCAGLAPLSGGHGLVLGHDLGSRRERRELRRQTGLLAHATFLYDELTVKENLLFWARANRLDLASVEPVLDRLALANRLRDVRVAHLSAGQRRRASLAVLVCRRPRLWLLDEPHAGLDVNGRDFVDGLIKHAVAFGGTVLLASHDYDRAGGIATRTVIVAGGQIMESELAAAGSPPGAAEPRTGRPATVPLASDPDWRPGASTAGSGPGAHAALAVRAAGSSAAGTTPGAGGGSGAGGTGSARVTPVAAGTPPSPEGDTPAGEPAPLVNPGSRWRPRRREAAESS
jgi:heme ABC exporter ATP-binding subunit CcmA